MWEGGFWHMAWIPKPVGEVRQGDDGWQIGRRIGEGMGMGTKTVSTRWKQKIGEPVRSRFAGLWSEIHARTWREGL